jgi:hypothetical protein
LEDGNQRAMIVFFFIKTPQHNITKIATEESYNDSVLIPWISQVLQL